MSADLRLGLGLVALMALALTALTIAGIPHRRGVVTAALRALAQLTFVALVLRGVFASPPTAALALAVMYGVACGTAARRLRDHPFALRRVALASLAGAAPVVGLVVGLPVLSRDVQTLVAVGGITLGGTMTASTLVGRRLTSAFHERADEIEAWLSIGATSRQAVQDIARRCVYEALVPGLDQTRTVGLVTLPGAFVGALLGGAGAADAARFQLVVLVGLLAAQSVTATVLAHLLGAPATFPAGPADTPGTVRAVGTAGRH